MTWQRPAARRSRALRRWPALGNGLTLAVRFMFWALRLTAAPHGAHAASCRDTQVLVYMTAKVSGGKLNPAVSLGLLVSGSISAFIRQPAFLPMTTV